MKILHVNAGRHWGGKESRLVTEMLWLNANGHETLLVCDPESALAKACADKTLPFQTLLMRRRHDLRATIRIVQIARDFRPDVLNIHTGVDAYLCAPLKFTGTPTVRMQNIHLNPGQKLSTRLSYRLTCHRIICLTDLLFKSLTGEFGFPESKIDLVPDSVDLEKFHPGHDRTRFRTELGMKEGELLIGMIAMLRSEKGHEHFIAAAENILRHRTDCKFIMVGSPTKSSNVLPWIQERIMKLYGSLDRSNPIVHIDYREDTPEIFSALDIFVHPALSEAQGLVISEAFASRKPVVASNTGGIPERVIHGKTGLLAEPGNSDDLTDKIMQLIESPALREQLAQAGYERVQQDGSIDRMMEKMLESYQKAIGQKSPGYSPQ